MMTETGTSDRSTGGSGATKPSPGWLRKLLQFDDPDVAIRRVRRNALVLGLVLAVGIGVVTRSPWELGGFLASTVLILLNFQALIAVADRLIDLDEDGPGVLQALFLVGRYVLLGLVLCGIVLLPRVGVIPVALGLSILVLAILLEAIAQASTGAHRQS